MQEYPHFSKVTLTGMITGTSSLIGPVKPFGETETEYLFKSACQKNTIRASKRIIYDFPQFFDISE